jgi:hypothetical protein
MNFERENYTPSLAKKFNPIFIKILNDFIEFQVKKSHKIQYLPHLRSKK